MSLLLKWIIKNNYNKIDTEHPITHLRLDGGKLSIPYSKLNQFYKLYAKDVSSNIKHYLCETKTPCYKLFVDVDLLNEDALPDDLILEYSMYIHEVICYYYKDLKPELIVCTTTPKAVEHNGYKYTKTGIHLIWSNIIVSHENISWIRESIIQYLILKVGEREHDKWSKVIDDSVYKQNGLRMIYSNKMAFCKTCKKSDTCSLCKKTGKYHEGRPYIPYKQIDSEYKVEIYNPQGCDDFILDMIKKTSIVSKDKISQYNLEKPEWFKSREIKQNMKRLDLGFEDLQGSAKLKFKEKIFNDDLIFNMIEDHIRKYIPNYSQIKLSDIHRCSNGEYYVCRTNVSYCMNIEKEHKSNTIYFYIDKSHIYQKCFCNCDTIDGRKFGKCMNYRSNGFKLNKRLIKILYPYEDLSVAVKGICELNTIIDMKRDKVTYINNLQIYLNYLELEIMK
jgi:hypothetical protein